jgi:hypothetical protein
MKITQGVTTVKYNYTLSAKMLKMIAKSEDALSKEGLRHSFLLKVACLIVLVMTKFYMKEIFVVVSPSSKSCIAVISKIH